MDRAIKTKRKRRIHSTVSSNPGSFLVDRTAEVDEVASGPDLFGLGLDPRGHARANVVVGSTVVS